MNWASLARNKDHIGAIQSIVSIFAITIGGVYFLLRFDRPSELDPEFSMSQQVSGLELDANNTVQLKIDLTISNSSKTSAKIPMHYVTVSRLLPFTADNVKIVNEMIGNVHSNARVNLPILKDILFRDPLTVPAGGSVLISHVLFVPRLYDDNQEHRIKTDLVRTTLCSASDCGKAWRVETLFDPGSVNSVQQTQAPASAASAKAAN